jgi:hypothetical protein
MIKARVESLKVGPCKAENATEKLTFRETANFYFRLKHDEENRSGLQGLFSYSVRWLDCHES